MWSGLLLVQSYCRILWSIQNVGCSDQQYHWKEQINTFDCIKTIIEGRWDLGVPPLAEWARCAPQSIWLRYFLVNNIFRIDIVDFLDGDIHQGKVACEVIFFGWVRSGVPLIQSDSRIIWPSISLERINWNLGSIDRTNWLTLLTGLRSFEETLSLPLYLDACKLHCVNSVQIRSIFWSVFSCIRTEYKYRKIQNKKTPHLDIFHAVLFILPTLQTFWFLKWQV